MEVYAVPEPKISWYKDGQEVRADARIKIQRDSQRLETYNLTLNLIKRGEAGVYELKATNTLGTAVAKSVVTVHSEYNFIIIIIIQCCIVVVARSRTVFDVLAYYWPHSHTF